MASRTGRSDRGKAARKKASRRKPSAGGGPDRLEELEAVVLRLLQASLRGRLLPAERRIFKEFIELRKQRAAKSNGKQPGHRCPVCRSPLSSTRIKRCPWCSVLLSQTGTKKR
jgi:hypothetical protein